MAVDDPWAIDGNALSALEYRRAFAGLFPHTTDAISALSGVLSGCAVSISGLTVTITGGQCLITPTAGSNGSYLVGATSTTLLATVQDATYARIDLVIARIYDNAVDGSGQSKADLQIVTGTASASPAAPALPSGALLLAQLNVPASGSPITVSDKRLFTAAMGGMIAASTYASLPTGAFLRVGQRGVALDTGITWRWSGSAWTDGDTGWRALTLTNGWAATSFGIRRIGSTVFASINALSAAARTSTTVVLIPSGFKSSAQANAYGLLGRSANPSVAYRAIASDYSFQMPDITAAAALTMWGSMSWPTDDAWPTTLPGSAL